MAVNIPQKPEFKINGYDFRVDTDIESESEINLVKTKMYVPNKAWGYNDIQWTNFTGESIELTIYSRITDKYTGEEAQPKDVNMGIKDFYKKTRTPHAVLKYWAQNFVKCELKTDLQAYENGTYVIESFKQSNPTYDFVVTDLTLIQYEEPSEINQSYYSPAPYIVDTSLLAAGVDEIQQLELHSQSCDCNEFTPAMQCTSPIQDDVKVIQKYLQDWGYFPTYTKQTGTIKPSGRYCYTTTIAIMKFQKAYGIPVSGDFTEETRRVFLKKITQK